MSIFSHLIRARVREICGIGDVRGEEGRERAVSRSVCPGRSGRRQGWSISIADIAGVGELAIVLSEGWCSTRRGSVELS